MRVVVAGGGALTAAVVAAIKKYKREAYAAYESLSGKKLEKDENGINPAIKYIAN